MHVHVQVQVQARARTTAPPRRGREAAATKRCLVTSRLCARGHRPSAVFENDDASLRRRCSLCRDLYTATASTRAHTQLQLQRLHAPPPAAAAAARARAVASDAAARFLTSVPLCLSELVSLSLSWTRSLAARAS